MDNDLQMIVDEEIILLVSSRSHLRDYYVQALSSLNVTVIAVADGFEALDILRNTKITAILADLSIPGMNGVELFLRTKELLFNVPFVIFTDRISARSREEALKVGVMKVLLKPTNKAEVCDVLREAIEQRQRQLLQFFC